MGKSFWGRLEAQKHGKRTERVRPVPKAAPEVRVSKREARLLLMLECGTSDDALRHAHSLVDEVRVARGLPTTLPRGKVPG